MFTAIEHGYRSGSQKILMLFIALLFFSIFISMASANGSPDLPRKLRQTLDQRTFPALRMGDDTTFFDSFGSILSKVSPARIREIEDYASSLQLKSPMDHFVSLALMRIEQGVELTGSKIRLRDAAYLIEGINKRLVGFFEASDSHPFMQDPIKIPTDWLEARNQFWDAHVLKNDFLNNSRLLEYGNQILQPLTSAIQSSEDVRINKVLSTFKRNETDFQNRFRELNESVNEARLIRFRRSLKDIESSEDLEKRLVAGMSLQIDAEEVVQFLKLNTQIRSTSLAQPGLVNEIESALVVAQGKEKDLLKKARTLRSGLHWWFRGRYGRGIAFGGLMKSKSIFNNRSRLDGEELNALYMPRERPKPMFHLITLSQKNSAEGPDYFRRRHYYTWAIENRPVVKSVSQNEERGRSETSNSSQVVSQTKFESQDFFF